MDPDKPCNELKKSLKSFGTALQDRHGHMLEGSQHIVPKASGCGPVHSTTSRPPAVAFVVEDGFLTNLSARVFTVQVRPYAVQ